MTPVRITHYSDILCIWAHVGQIRVTELQANFPQEVVFDFRYFSVFGDVHTKMEAQWEERGGLAGYAQHVQKVAAQFEDVSVCSDTWRKNTPTSSLPAHLLLAAARLVDDEQESDSAPLLADAIREAFFVAAVDVSCMTELLTIADRQGIMVTDLEGKMDNGQAHALMACDQKSANETGIRVSPTMTLNEERQMLCGNVGYRVLEANVRELMQHPAGQPDWY